MSPVLHAWDPEADCPAIDRFVQRVFPYDAHEVLYQLAGLFLTPDSRCQKAVLFLGSGASGKSVATALIRQFLHPRNVSNVPLHDLTPGRFDLAELRGKLLNISADVPERDFNDTAVFKQIVDGQLATLRVPRKYRDPIEFQPFTRLLASAARVPQSADNSLGYLRRWLAVPFDTSLNESNLDRTLLDQLTIPDELSGLLNRAVSAYRQLLEKGTLTESEKMAAAKAGVRPGFRLHSPLPQRASRGVFPIRRDRPHRPLRRLQGLVRLQPLQPRQRPPPLQLHLGCLQNQNGQKPRTQAVARASSSSPSKSLHLNGRSKRGPKGQKQGRNDFLKVPPSFQSCDRTPHSFERGPKGPEGQVISKNFFVTPKVFRLSAKPHDPGTGSKRPGPGPFHCSILPSHKSRKS